ncbi:unnamed protein product, partial [Prunus brigantina]
MLSRKMKGVSTPGTPGQKNMKGRRAEKSRLSALEKKVELLLEETDVIQDQNKTLRGQNERLEEQQIGLQANLRRAQKKAVRDSYRTRRVERRLFDEETASTGSPRGDGSPDDAPVESSQERNHFREEPAPRGGKEALREAAPSMVADAEPDLREAIRAMIKGEMGMVIGDTKAPKIALYEGLTDPYDHLDNFRYAMEGRGANEATKCRLFPTTLKGAALNWFKRLSPESVGSFSELRRAFLDRYMIISSRLYTANDLSAVRQKTNESLRDYITRFNNEYARCEGCDEATAHNALGGLQGGDFFFHLTRNPPETYKDLLREATCYSRAEQLNSARTGTARDRDGDVGHSRPPEPRKGNPQKKDQNRLPSRRDRAPERYYTPLKTNKEAILAIAGKELPTPRQGRHEYLGRRDEARYCKYHRAYGHSTDDCYQLKEGIEALVQRGRLREHVARPGTDPRPSEQAPPAPGPRRLISTIGGGPSPGGDSNRSRKRYARSLSQETGHAFSIGSSPQPPKRTKQNQLEPIVFTSDDGYTSQLHSDPVVITFRTPHGVGAIQGDQISSRNCYVSALKGTNVPGETLAMGTGRCPPGYVATSGYRPRPYERPMTITACIARRDVPNVLLEKRSPVNILFSSALRGLGLESRELFPATGQLYAFDGARVRVLGHLKLLASVGLFPGQTGTVARFLVADHPSPYPAIFGHPLLWALRVTLCYYTRTLRLPTFQGTTMIFADRPADVDPVFTLSTEGSLPEPMDDPREKHERPQPFEDLE